jgi:hypothetical protein
MQRRRFIAGLVALTVGVAWPFSRAVAHSPYRLWDLFRKQNLQILTSHADYAGDDLGEEWVVFLRKNLPLSRAMISRALNLVRVASLLKTNQSKLAVLSYKHARLMFTGVPPLDQFAPLLLEVLIDNGKYLLVARPSLPLQHGFMITAALMEDAEKLQLVNPVKGKFGMVVHAGSKAFFNGEKIEIPKEL